jgi:hypothetical protein
MTGLNRLGAIAGVAACLAAGVAWGQESTEEIKKELLAKGAADESVGLTLYGAPAAPTGLAALSPEPMPVFDDNPTGANTWLKTIKLSGFVDIGYTKNFNDPRNGPLTNPGRMFDTTSNGFLFNMGEVMLEKVASADSPGGFRMKLGVGKDAGFLASTENLGTSAQFDIVEGYVEYLAPVGNGIDFKAGKMATLAGYEVIESKDNWSYSRSLLFTWAIPLTHTGVRATYAFVDQVSLTLGYVNGWNMISDNNNGKTFEGQLNLNPTSWFNAIVNSYYGPELGTGNTTNTSGAQRYVVDICATATVSTWKFGLNYDSGHDDQAAAGAPDSWSGIAGYVKDQVVRWYAPSLRVEQFRDSKGAVTAFVPSVNGAPANTGFTIGNQGAVPAGAIKLWEVTFSNEFKINDNLLFRAEYRHDQADKRVFQEGNDVQGKKGQDTIGLEAIFMF